MDVAAVDAFAAFIIVYALFIVVVLPINLSIEHSSLSLSHVARINSWLRNSYTDKHKVLTQP